MRMRKKPNLIPRMERCAAVLEREPQTLRGRWREVYPGYDALHLELGCGKGRFTAGTAAAEPRVLLAAVEKVPDAMVVAMERVTAAGLANVRFMDLDAARLLEVFAPGEADRIYLNFSDPWPGKRHAKRRLTHPNFLALYRQVLAPGGELHMKTDNADLFAWSLEMFRENGWLLSEVTDDLHRDGVVGIMTDFEAKFVAQGLPIHRCVATPDPAWTPPAPEEPKTEIKEGNDHAG